MRVTLTNFKEPDVGRRLAFAPGGRMLVTWAGDVVTWDVATGKELDRFLPPGPVLAVRFTPDGREPATLVVTNRRRGGVFLWDVETGEVRATLRGLRGGADPDPLAFSPDGGVIATGGRDGNVRLWDARPGHLRFVLRGHPGPINLVAFRPDGRALAASGPDGAVSLWLAGGGPKADP